MRWGRLRALNHRGRAIPISLGLLVASFATAGFLWVAPTRHVGSGGWIVAAGSGLVFAAGLVDDLTPGGPRGVRSHLRALAAFHVTTGLLKLIIVVAVSLVVVAALPRRPVPVTLAGVVAMAACTNVWNGLDVLPGRALKAFAPAVVGLLAASPPLALVPTLPGVAAGALVAFPFDLRERAMLGDGGSNLLGFTVGVGSYVMLPGWGVAVVAALGVALNVLADTISLSRAIDAAAPIRWLDRVGRIPADR